MNLRDWWERLVGRAPAPREPLRVPATALREIAETERQQRAAAERLALVGVLGAVPEWHTTEVERNEQVYRDARARVDIMLEGGSAVRTNIAVEEAAWVALGLVSFSYAAPFLWRAWGRWRALLRDGRNGRAKILLRGDVVISAIILAVLVAQTVPGVISAFRPSPPMTLARATQIGLLMSGMILLTILVWYRARMYRNFYRYVEPATPSQIAEVLAEVQRGITLTEGARDEAKTAGDKAEATGVAAEAAHTAASEVLVIIKEQTRRGPGEEGA